MTITQNPKPSDEVINRLAPNSTIRMPKSPLPEGTCDSHCHVIAPVADAKFVSGRGYTPPAAPLSAYRKMAHALGISRSVLVQPSVYCTDNRVMLAALATLGPSARGVVVVDPHITDAALQDLHAQNVRGVRINMACPGGLSLEDVKMLAPKIKSFGWHIQIFCRLVDLAGHAELLSTLGVPVIVDHFGFPQNRPQMAKSEMALLRRLRQDYGFWFKLSAPYRIAPTPPAYEVSGFVDALLDEGVDRLVWGTDWPHTDLTEHMPDDGDLCDLVSHWLPDPVQRRAVLVDNPAHIYGFDALHTQAVKRS